MSEQQGKLIYRCRDDFGDIQVYESATQRQLYFDTRHKQSAMALDQPTVLCLPYFQAMMGALLFSPTPHKVLIVGLGSGALVKFVHTHFPHCSIEFIEYRQKVIDVAYAHFALPKSDSIQIHAVDAGMFLHAAPMPPYHHYDLILVDLFDSHGLSSVVTGRDFYTACRKRLSERGVFSINLWGSDKQQFREHAREIIHSFATQASFLPADGCGNIIGLGCNQALTAELVASLPNKARQLKKATGLDFNRFLKELKKHNTDFFQPTANSPKR